MQGTFRLWIELGNDAMRSRHDIAGALQLVAIRVKKGEKDGIIRDDNGNTVGHFTVEGDENGNDS